MDRTSKLFILVWAVAALLIEGYYVSGAYHPALLMTTVLFVAAALAVAFDRRSVAGIFAISYLVPVLIYRQTGQYHATYTIVWLAPLLGAIFPDALRRAWHVPQRWSPALVCWVGGVCLTAPVIALRAVDFRWELLFRGRLPTEALGGLPLLTIAWVLHVALLLAIGLLWFDWVCGQESAFVARWIALPMAASVSVLMLVTGYQMLVDVSFLNPTVYASFQRASGTLLDGNAAGTVAACWIGGWVMLARRLEGGWRTVGYVMAAIMWVPVWATGSRTALAAALMVTAIVAAGIPARRGRSRLIAAAIALVVLVAAVGLIAVLPRPVSGPLARIGQMVPSTDMAGVRVVAAELWNRNGYGTAAARAIAAYPLFGIGVGSFHEMASEFVPGGIAPDNAQNWYRHQLAELGVIGSLGWIAFLWMFGSSLGRAGARAGETARPIAAVLIAIAVISLLGMPGQDPFVAITLWTFAGWHVVSAGRIDGPSPSAWHWRGAVAVAVVFAVGTLYFAVGPLRLPERIQRLGGEYLYGLYWPEPDGQGGEYRWARREATAVVPITTRAFEITLRSNRGDLAEHPVHVTALVNGSRVIEATLRPGQESVTASITLPDRYRYAVVDTSADSAVVAPPPDGRELAVMVSWRSLPGGPPLMGPSL